MIEGLIQGFSQELNLSAEDIADTLWLALQITSDSPDSPISQNELPPEPRKLPDSPSSPHEPTSSAPASQKQESPDFPSPREHLAEPHIPEPKQEQKAEIYARNEQQSSKTAGLSIKVPDAYALREPLALARALKPLMRRVASHQKRQILDEVATAQLIAEKNIWRPILKPTLEPWLDLDLVVDESISMQIWRAPLKEVEKLLKNYGIFRDVRVWGLMTDDPENIQIRRGIGITAKNQSPRSPKELIDPSGRRLVLLASDCVSSVWRNGTLTPLLKIWAKHGSMAIMQMLPQWMWKRTGLAQATEVRLRGLHPGDFNPTLMMESLAFWDELDEEQGVKVPVFSLEPERVLSWAQVLAGKGSVSVAGYFFDLDDIAFASESPSLYIGGNSSAKRRVQEFRVTASPMARKLAGLLASAPVITLPIVRLIQETLLPDSRQFNVAEVFLGGLLKPLSEVKAETNPDYVQYDFMEGIRELLLESVPSNYVFTVIEEISNYVAKKLGLSIEEFGAILKNPRQAEEGEIAENMMAFARVTAQVLRGLGGVYVEVAESLENEIIIDEQEPPHEQTQLIQTLLEVRGKTQVVKTVLQNNQHLLNSNLIFKIKQISNLIVSEGNDEAARWLENLVAQSSENVVDTSPYLELFYELLRTIVDTDSDPQVIDETLSRNTDKLNEEFSQAMTSWSQNNLVNLEPGIAKALIAAICNLSNDLQRFALGNRANNLEIAITGYNLGLTVFERQNHPELWASLQDNLGTAYSKRIKGERAENLEMAIAYHEAALEVYTREAYPKDWARTLNNLGAVFCDRINEERTDNLDKANDYYQSALEVRSRQVFPEDWASTQLNLGTLYSNQIRGERAENLEKTITCYEAVLEVYTRSAYPYEWAIVQNNLGSAYSNRIRRERVQNLENAIACYQSALEIYTRDSFPEDWTLIQNNLGNAYRNRIRGERSQNLEYAIACYQSALEIYTRNAFPEGWALIQNNLGNAYKDRIRGERSQNLEYAIFCYQSTLEIYTRQTFPENWALIQNNLGNAYRNRIRGEHSQNLEEAISCFRSALEVYTRDAFPQYWAMTQNNLGIAYSDRVQGERFENLERAIACLRAALEVHTRQTFPQYWAETQNNLGNAYKNCIRGDREQNLEEAISCYRAALKVRTPSSFPLDCLDTAHNLGDLGYDLQNWEIAIEGYDNAIRAVEQSRDWATFPDTKRKILEEALPIYGKMVQACIHVERYDQALLTVERSKSRTLMEMLTSADLVPKNATPEQQEQYRQLNREIAALQQSFPELERPGAWETGSGQGVRTELADALETAPLQSLLQQRETLVAQINDPNFNPFQNVRPQLPDFRQLLTPETALIEWYLPQDPALGAWAFTVTLNHNRPQIHSYSYSADQRQTLDQFNQTYFADYRQPSWYDALDRRLDDLAEHLHLFDIIAALPDTCQRLILIPHLYLHLFPLHALSVELNAPATPLLEHFSQGVSYAPSCQILDYIHNRPQPATEPQFFAVQNPTEDLSYAQMEVEFIRPYFDPNCYILTQQSAKKSAFNRQETLEKLRQSNVIHFACHGGFDSENPLNSAVILAGDAPLESDPTEKKRQTLTLRDGRRFDTTQQGLTLGEIYRNLEKRQTLTLRNGSRFDTEHQGLTLGEIYRNLEIPACRLVMLSADETGLSSSLLTDEYIGLASGFLYAGTSSVVSSLWCMDDFATACLVIRFYYELHQDGRVVMALHHAQNWLRRVSVEGCLEWCTQDLKMTEDECEMIEFKLMDYDESCPFGDRRYWSAFVAIGL